MEAFFLNKVFLLQYLAEFIESIKTDSNVQNEKSQAIDKYNKELFSTKSKIGQNALAQRKVFEQAKNIMGDTIEDKDREKKQKDKEIEFEENKKKITRF